MASCSVEPEVLFYLLLFFVIALVLAVMAIIEALRK
jgi:hypothetical protein